MLAITHKQPFTDAATIPETRGERELVDPMASGGCTRTDVRLPQEKAEFQARRADPGDPSDDTHGENSTGEIGSSILKSKCTNSPRIK